MSYLERCEVCPFPKNNLHPEMIPASFGLRNSLVYNAMNDDVEFWTDDVRAVTSDQEKREYKEKYGPSLVLSAQGCARAISDGKCEKYYFDDGLQNVQKIQDMIRIKQITEEE